MLVASWCHLTTQPWAGNGHGAAVTPLECDGTSALALMPIASPGDDVRRRAILHAVEEHKEHTREHLERDEHESLVLLKNCSVFCSISSFYCVVQE